MPDELAPTSFHDGRYAVVGVLGEGGQATSYHAVDKKVGRPVVVKRFRVRGAKSWKEVELAEREAKVLSGLDHESLPRYVDHFEEGGELFLVTEYIEGESLAALRKRRERLGAADVIRFLRAASTTLDYLHGRAPPVVHRDIKPSNVLRRPDGSFAFIDFGAVRDRMKPEGGSTVVGTFGYMAPEQFQGRASPASDVYAVGATALVLLTGIEPEDLPHRGLAIDVASALRGQSVEPWVVRALERMLEPDPDRRAARIAPLLDDVGEAAPADDDRNPWPFRVEENGRSRRAEKRAERRARRKARRTERWVRGYGEPLELGGPIAFVVHLALRIAEIVVRLALLRVAVPVCLVFSALLGRVAREAAEIVRTTEREAQDEIRNARAYTIGKRARAEGGGAPPKQARVRVDASPPPKARAKPIDEDAALHAEAEAEVDEAMRGVSAKAAPRKVR